METSFGKRRNALATSPRKFQGKTSMSAALAIRSELMSELPPLLRSVGHSAKVIALKVGATPRSVEGHRQEEQLPRLDVGLAYAKQYPEVRRLFMRLMDAETGESGENPSLVLDQIQKLLQERTA